MFIQDIISFGQLSLINQQFKSVVMSISHQFNEIRQFVVTKMEISARAFRIIEYVTFFVLGIIEVGVCFSSLPTEVYWTVWIVIPVTFSVCLVAVALIGILVHDDELGHHITWVVIVWLLMIQVVASFIIFCFNVAEKPHIWTNIEDPSLVHDFEQKHKCCGFDMYDPRRNATYYNSSSEWFLEIMFCTEKVQDCHSPTVNGEEQLYFGCDTCEQKMITHYYIIGGFGIFCSIFGIIMIIIDRKKSNFGKDSGNKSRFLIMYLFSKLFGCLYQLD